MTLTFLILLTASPGQEGEESSARYWLFKMTVETLQAAFPEPLKTGGDGSGVPRTPPNFPCPDTTSEIKPDQSVAPLRPCASPSSLGPPGDARFPAPLAPTRSLPSPPQPHHLTGTCSDLLIAWCSLCLPCPAIQLVLKPPGASPPTADACTWCPLLCSPLLPSLGLPHGRALVFLTSPSIFASLGPGVAQ